MRFMSRKGKFLATTAAIVSMGGAYALAQGAAGPFTQAQVTDGRADYAANCAGCHSANLAGSGDVPALTGATFNSSWAAKSTKEFYQFVSTSMPYGNAGNLSPQAYGNVIAFILAANGGRPGTAPLTAASDVKISTIANGQLVAQVVGGGAAAGGQRVAQAGGGAAPAGDGDTPPPRGRGASPFPLGQTVQGTVKNYQDITDAMLVNPPDGDWLMGRRTYAGWSYSPLTQITPDNVKNLRRADLGKPPGSAGHCRL
jgi:alcohol dehydrogenase (cytochrome c)